MNPWLRATGLLPTPAANLEHPDLLSSGLLLLLLSHCCAGMETFNLLSAIAMFWYRLGRLWHPSSHGERLPKGVPGGWRVEPAAPALGCPSWCDSSCPTCNLNPFLGPALRAGHCPSSPGPLRGFKGLGKAWGLPCGSVRWRDQWGWEGAALGGLGRKHLHFPRVDVCHLLACTVGAWLFW